MTGVSPDTLRGIPTNDLSRSLGTITLTDYIKNKTKADSFLPSPSGMSLTPPNNPNALASISSVSLPTSATRTKDYLMTPEQEAIAGSLDLNRMGLQSEFANQGATGSGALQSMMLQQAADTGSKMANQIAIDKQNKLDEYSQLLSMTNDPDKQKLLIDEAMKGYGLDVSNLKPTTDRERVYKKAVEDLGIHKNDKGVWVDDKGNTGPATGAFAGKSWDQVLNFSMDKWASGALGFSDEFTPDVSSSTNKLNNYSTLIASGKVNDVLMDSSTEAKKAITNGLKDGSVKWSQVISDPYYTSESFLADFGFSKGYDIAETDNAWFDEGWYVSSFGSENGDGDVTYDKGTKFWRWENGKRTLYEIVSSAGVWDGDKHNGDGSWGMKVKNLVTGAVSTIYP
jgi:hypothetical protein